MAEELRRDSSPLHVWHNGRWYPVHVLYGTYFEAIVWNLRFHDKVKYKGTEITADHLVKFLAGELGKDTPESIGIYNAREA